jgi:flavin reductase (DIM6/NTAB) family NADH-FMN oxidoreductase RutF
MDQGQIHDEHPFATPAEQRDPVRQLRGRLAVPVTVVTAGHGDQRTGLTVSSLVVAEGDPALVYCLLGPATDLLEAIEDTERFVVHVVSQGHREVADVFAGLRPSPGGLFAGRTVTATPYGPQLDGFGTYALCSLVEAREESYSVLVAGRIDEVVLEDLVDPLVYFRGAYRRLEP